MFEYLREKSGLGTSYKLIGRNSSKFEISTSLFQVTFFREHCSLKLRN